MTFQSTLGCYGKTIIDYFKFVKNYVNKIVLLIYFSLKFFRLVVDNLTDAQIL